MMIVFTISVSACASSRTTTEVASMSSDDVLRTAEAIAELTRTASTATPSPTLVPPSATAVVETPTPEATETPSVPTVEALYNANVRSGPDETYGIIDFFLQGQHAEVIGRFDHPDLGTWWFVDRIGEGLNGWVWSGAVTFSGNPGLVPYFEAPPTETPIPPPTDTPEPTATDVNTDQ
jgi:hypothetical protein